MDSSKYFNDDYKLLLPDIQFNFEANLNRNIYNTMKRKIRFPLNPYQFRPIAFREDKTFVMFRDLKLTSPALFESGNVRLNLLEQSIDCDFKLFDILLEGNSWTYTINDDNTTALKRAKIAFNVHGTAVTGKVGIYNKEDSWVPATYAVKLVPKGVRAESTTKPDQQGERSEGDSEDEVVKTEFDTIEASPLRWFWIAVERFIIAQFQRMIDSEVVEYSYGEMFLDEPGQMLEYGRARMEHANVLFNSALGEFQERVAEEPQQDLSLTFVVGGRVGRFHAEGGPMPSLIQLIKKSVSMFDMGDEKLLVAQMEMPDLEYTFGECKIAWLTGDQRQYRMYMKMAPERACFLVTVHLNADDPDKSPISLKMQEFDLTFLHVDEPNNLPVMKIINSFQPLLLTHVRDHISEMFQRQVKAYNDSLSH